MSPNFRRRNPRHGRSSLPQGDTNVRRVVVTESSSPSLDLSVKIGGCFAVIEVDLVSRER
jgi:hypothetical protein